MKGTFQAIMCGLAMSVFAVSGCASFYGRALNHGLLPDDGGKPISPTEDMYIGTRLHVDALGRGNFTWFVVDMPVSFVADTVLFPIDLARLAFYSPLETHRSVPSPETATKNRRS